MPALTKLTSSNDAECTECIAPAEKELLQSSGHIQSTMSGAEEGAIIFASHEIEMSEKLGKEDLENSNLVEMDEEVDTESRENLSDNANMDSESTEISSEKWGTEGRRRFVIALYPGPSAGITAYMQWRGGRRRHQYITKKTFTTGSKAGMQDMYWDGKRIKNDMIKKCLDVNKDHEDTLFWYSCHNGGNQQFWKESRKGDADKKAYHIVVGGDMGRRRRGVCVDYGGGNRFYIHGCHNGDNQRFKFIAATTTTSTTTTKTLPPPATPPPVGPQIKTLGQDPAGKLKACEGDCDRDSGCEGNLQCFQRDGFTIPPGCGTADGLGEKGYDYCYDPDKLGLPTIRFAGVDPDTSKEKLQKCVGDCDKDDDCEGGLTCYQRDDGPSVPGCSGQPNGAYDYCFLHEPFRLSDKGVDPKVKLGQCTGDCDKDADCEGDLKCHQRDGQASVPGCEGVGAPDWDYCTHETFGKINSR